MFTRSILMSSILASAVALSSGLALAATTPATTQSQHEANGISHMQNAGNLAKQCSGLEAEFDQAISGHKDMKAFQDAKALRKEGGNMCAQGADAAGIRYLKTAVSEVGAVPKVY